MGEPVEDFAAYSYFSPQVRDLFFSDDRQSNISSGTCCLREALPMVAGFVSSTGGGGDKTFEVAAFLERMRSMLVLEEGDQLWLARGTPRTWLEQGKKVSVKNAPCRFGTVAYDIASDIEHGKVIANVDLPSPCSAKTVLLRIRHPKQVPIKKVAVHGTAWTDFDPAKEIIRLTGLAGTVKIEVSYD